MSAVSECRHKEHVRPALTIRRVNTPGFQDAEQALSAPSRPNKLYQRRRGRRRLARSGRAPCARISSSSRVGARRRLERGRSTAARRRLDRSASPGRRQPLINQSHHQYETVAARRLTGGGGPAMAPGLAAGARGRMLGGPDRPKRVCVCVCVRARARAAQAGDKGACVRV